MGRRLSGLLQKEFIQFFRDPVMLTVVLYFYTACIVICAYALTFEVKDLTLEVVDYDRTPTSRELVDQMIATKVFKNSGRLDSVEEASSRLRHGRASLAIVIPNDFERRLHRGTATKLQVLIDGTNPNVAAQARAHVLAVVDQFERDWRGRTERLPGIRPVIRVWYNSSLSYSSFIVVSMIAIAALIVGVIHPAASFVREKEVGTIEQLQVTPIGVIELFVGKTAPTLFMGLVSIFPSFLIVWWFGVPFEGRLPLLLALTALFLLSAIGIGVLIASVTRTLQQALLLGFFGLFPMMFLSGTIVPIESMPDLLQTLSLASPLRHYLEAILGIFFKGAGLRELWPKALSLVAIGATLFGMAGLIFRRTWN